MFVVTVAKYKVKIYTVILKVILFKTYFLLVLKNR